MIRINWYWCWYSSEGLLFHRPAACYFKGPLVQCSTLKTSIILTLSLTLNLTQTLGIAALQAVDPTSPDATCFLHHQSIVILVSVAKICHTHMNWKKHWERLLAPSTLLWLPILCSFLFHISSLCEVTSCFIAYHWCHKLIHITITCYSKLIGWTAKRCKDSTLCSEKTPTLVFCYISVVNV